jgi:hypothetical protein
MYAAPFLHNCTLWLNKMAVKHLFVNSRSDEHCGGGKACQVTYILSYQLIK